MIFSGLFARYARALADIVLEKREEQQVAGELRVYREIFRTVPDLLSAFDSPAVPRDAKVRILDGLMRQYPVGETTANFLRVILEHNRIRYFEEIFDHYVRTVNARQGVVAAQVTAAAPVAESDLAELRNALKAATGRAVQLEVKTDPELIGGLVVQVGSTVYDGSVRSQLAEMRKRLAET